MKKNIFLTPELAANKNLDQIIKEKEKTIFNKNPLKQLGALDINSAIYIYDQGFNYTEKIIPINNHINKTGINPMRELKQTGVDFFDITSIYKHKKRGKIAECFGNHQPAAQKNAQYIQGHFLCNYVILSHYVGFNNIYAFIVD